MSDTRTKYVSKNGRSFTVWRPIPGDGFRDDDSYESPRIIKAAFGDKPKLVMDQSGDKFVPNLTVLCKLADDVRRGDKIVIGEYTELTPIPEARKVRQVATYTPLHGTEDLDVYAV